MNDCLLICIHPASHSAIKALNSHSRSASKLKKMSKFLITQTRKYERFIHSCLQKKIYLFLREHKRNKLQSVSKVTRLINSLKLIKQSLKKHTKHPKNVLIQSMASILIILQIRTDSRILTN